MISGSGELAWTLNLTLGDDLTRLCAEMKLDLLMTVFNSNCKFHLKSFCGLEVTFPDSFCLGMSRVSDHVMSVLTVSQVPHVRPGLPG